MLRRGRSYSVLEEGRPRALGEQRAYRVQWRDKDVEVAAWVAAKGGVSRKRWEMMYPDALLEVEIIVRWKQKEVEVFVNEEQIEPVIMELEFQHREVDFEAMGHCFSVHVDAQSKQFTMRADNRPLRRQYISTV